MDLQALPLPPISAADLLAALFGVAAWLLTLGGVQEWRRAMTRRRLLVYIGAANQPAARGDVALAAVAQRSRTWVRRRLNVAQANPQRTRTAAIFTLAISVILAVGTGGAIWVVIAAAAGGVLYPLGAEARQRDLVLRQAGPAIQLMASGMRAGYSVRQTIALVSRESAEPTAGLFRDIGQEVELGVPLEESLNGLASRYDIADYQMLAIIVWVQRNVGGNLAVVLDSVAETVRERLALREQVGALTAQQRLASIILTVLPFGILLFLRVVDSSFVDPLFGTLVGRLILGTVILLVTLGWVGMRAVGRVDV